MQDPQGSLIHEATSLFRLVESIDRFVGEHENLYAYTLATRQFFRLIHEHSKNAKNDISEIIHQAALTSGPLASRYTGQLLIMKGRWKTVHTYITPATDAHTLKVPVPLLQMATGHLRMIPGIKDAGIVPLLTPELMYYQNTPRTPFSDELLFVEIPYSQGPGFFTNLSIYHEIGHWVFDRLSDSGDHAASFAELNEATELAFKAKLSAALKSASTATWAKGVLAAWTQEIFCDLFAIRHLGPAFSFALIDMLSLIGLMRKDTESTFDNLHPAAALRFREQFQRLHKDGWWQIVKDLPSEHVGLITRLAETSESAYSFEFQDYLMPAFVEAFSAIPPLIHKLVLDLTPHCAEAAQDFGQHWGNIEKCLLHGVVPSHLLTEDSASPAPASMINAAYCFYLTRLPDLMNKLEGQRPTEPDHRRVWIDKLEAWTMKGVEDSQLLAGIEIGGSQRARA